MLIFSLSRPYHEVEVLKYVTYSNGRSAYRNSLNHRNLVLNLSMLIY